MTTPSPSSPPLTPTAPITVLIFTVNDVYETEHFGRLAKTIENVVEQRNPNSHYVCMNGDFLAPSFLSSIDKGSHKVQLMNATGFTHVCLGNHEFELSVANLLTQIHSLHAKVVNSNVSNIRGTIPQDISNIYLPSGEKFKIGWLGFCTEKTKRLCINIPADLKLDNVVENAPKKIDALKAKVDYVIAQTHIDVAEDRHLVSNSSVDLILGGHDHEPFIESQFNKDQKPVWIVKVGQQAERVGIVTIRIDPTTKQSTTTMETIELTDTSLPTNNSIENIIADGKQLEKEMANVVVIPGPIGAANAKSQQTQFASFILSQLRRWASVDTVLVQAGLFKGKKDYAKGLTVKEISKELRFGELSIAKLTGEVLSKAVALSRATSGKNFFQADDGIVYDQENKVVTHVNHKPIAPTHNYIVLIPISIINSENEESNPIIAEYLKVNPKNWRRYHTYTYEPPPTKVHISSISTISTISTASTPALKTNLSASADRKNPYHLSPSLEQTVLASLIEKKWDLLCRGKSFADFDKNKDGVIERKELQSELPPAIVDGIMLNLDVDGTNTITREEWDFAKRKLKDSNTAYVKTSPRKLENQ